MPLSVFAATALSSLGAPTASAAPEPTGPIVHEVSNERTNIAGTSLITVTVDNPPGAKSVPHHHAKSAFITAYVTKGAIRSRVDDALPHVFRTGESWIERPGAHHTISENASATEPAQLLAVFLVRTGDGPLTVDD
ncbi:cupin domain-containing protein [Tsukamurella pseudospumae]|uniref:cupin domain-containing protein n=1 Tax=Tsukamurella pseudospumae TaxID=239498 RepID=UPI0039E1A677